MDPNRRTYDTDSFKPAPTVIERIKDSVSTSAIYVKDTAVSTTRAVKERDWTKEKKLAQDAGTATKEAAVKVGAAAQKGTSWLYSKSKDLLNSNAATKPTSAPPPPASRPRY